MLEEDTPKLLIVDDQAGIRLLLHEVFSYEGLEIMQASNGKEALEYVTSNRPDIVLLDMKIPGMDGLEILSHIKQIDQTITVIMMTAYGELDVIKKTVDLGAATHYSKPFDIIELRDDVLARLNRKSVSTL